MNADIGNKVLAADIRNDVHVEPEVVLLYTPTLRELIAYVNNTWPPNQIKEIILSGRNRVGELSVSSLLQQNVVG